MSTHLQATTAEFAADSAMLTLRVVTAALEVSLERNDGRPNVLSVLDRASSRLVEMRVSDEVRLADVLECLGQQWGQPASIITPEAMRVRVAAITGTPLRPVGELNLYELRESSAVLRAASPRSGEYRIVVHPDCILTTHDGNVIAAIAAATGVREPVDLPIAAVRHANSSLDARAELDVSEQAFRLHTRIVSLMMPKAS